MRVSRLCFSLIFYSCSAVFAQTERGLIPATNAKSLKKSKDRLALVIGNAEYKLEGVSKLKNPNNDADSMALYLRNLGFDVLIHKNLGFQKTEEVIEEFGKKLKDYEIGLFFYAGHAAEVKDQNYLFPVDIAPKSEIDAVEKCYSLNRLLEQMEIAETRIKIVILDACRNNPFKASWTRGSGQQGLANMQSSAKGTLIAFAAKPGSTAEDGKGENGTYTLGILNNIATVNLSINDMFTRVTSDVKKATDDKQEPHTVSSLDQIYFLNHNPNAPMAPIIIYEKTILKAEGNKIRPSATFSTTLVNGFKYIETTNNNYLQLTALPGNKMNFTGQLKQYTVSGKIKQTGKQNFEIFEGNTTGTFAFSADGELLSANIFIKEAKQSWSFNFKHKK